MDTSSPASPKRHPDLDKSEKKPYVLMKYFHSFRNVLEHKFLRIYSKEKRPAVEHQAFLVYQELSNVPVPHSPQELYHSLMKRGKESWSHFHLSVTRSLRILRDRFPDYSWPKCPI